MQIFKKVNEREEAGVMNFYFLDQLAKEKMREAEEWAREARLNALLREPVRAGERRRLGVQLGRLAMIWLPLPDWLRICFAGGSQPCHCY